MKSKSLGVESDTRYQIEGKNWCFWIYIIARTCHFKYLCHWLEKEKRKWKPAYPSFSCHVSGLEGASCLLTAGWMAVSHRGTRGWRITRFARGPSTWTFKITHSRWDVNIFSFFFCFKKYLFSFSSFSPFAKRYLFGFHNHQDLTTFPTTVCFGFSFYLKSTILFLVRLGIFYCLQFYF